MYTKTWRKLVRARINKKSVIVILPLPDRQLPVAQCCNICEYWRVFILNAFIIFEDTHRPLEQLKKGLPFALEPHARFGSGKRI
jgi:hypothetical protein